MVQAYDLAYSVSADPIVLPDTERGSSGGQVQHAPRKRYTGRHSEVPIYHATVCNYKPIVVFGVTHDRIRQEPSKLS